MVPASQCGGEKSDINPSCCLALQHTGPSQVISNPQAQILEASYLLQDCESQLAGVAAGDAHQLSFSHAYGEVVRGNPFTNAIHIILELLHVRGRA